MLSTHRQFNSQAGSLPVYITSKKVVSAVTGMLGISRSHVPCAILCGSSTSAFCTC